MVQLLDGIDELIGFLGRLETGGAWHIVGAVEGVVFLGTLMLFDELAKLALLCLKLLLQLLVLRKQILVILRSRNV